jgi:hypothetical protein
LNRIFGTSEGNWLVPALHVVCKYTHKVALAADKENSKGGRQNMAKLQNAVQLLQDSYSKTFNDRTEYQVTNRLLSKERISLILSLMIQKLTSTPIHLHNFSQMLLLIPMVLKKPVS